MSTHAEKPPRQTYWAKNRSLSQTTVTLTQRMALLRQHGDFTLGYSTAVQPDLQYFGDHNGYIAYRTRMGIAFVLGDPVAPQAAQEDLLRDFLRTHRKPSFVHISETTATSLSSMGFRVNDIGVDTALDLDQYDFKGKSKEWLRYADNWIKRHGFTVAESTFEEVSVEQTQSISEAWRETRTIKSREVQFLNRPMVLKDEPDVRKWFLFGPDQQPLAYIFFDPLYSHGSIIGYVTCIKRRHPDAPQYAEHAIMKQAIEQFQSEGRSVVKLGLSPLAKIENKVHRCNRLVHYASRYYHSAQWVNRYFYGFLGHTRYKARFRGREEKVYYASPVLWNDLRFLCIATLCDFF